MIEEKIQVLFQILIKNIEIYILQLLKIILFHENIVNIHLYHQMKTKEKKEEERREEEKDRSSKIII